MKKKSLVIFVTALSLLCGCSNSQSNSNVGTFEKDDKTLTKDAASAWIVNENTRTEEELTQETEERRDNGITLYERDNTAGEFNLTNDDNSVEWQIANGRDIIYNGRTYYNLYSATTELPMPYSVNTFINFILKTYNTEAAEIYIIYQDDNDVTEDDSISIKEEAQSLYGYAAIAEKYGEDAHWIMNIHERGDNNPATLYGCSKFVVYQGGTDKVTIDMSEYDTGIVNENIEVNTDEESQNPEDTTEVAEDTNEANEDTNEANEDTTETSSTDTESENVENTEETEVNEEENSESN